MSPSYENLQSDDEFDEEEIDVSDLREQYEVRLDSSFDAFVVIDGLPVVPEESRDKLLKFLLRKINGVEKISKVVQNNNNPYMPLNPETGKTEGWAFVELNSPKEATAAIKALNGSPLDKKHTIAVNKLIDIDRYGGDEKGRIQEEYVEPELEPFQQKPHLRSWLGDRNARDQIIMYRSDDVGLYWHEREDQPEQIINRTHWTEMFVQWSPMGTYLLSMHAQGVQLWGGPDMTRQQRFPHPGVNLVDFSPHENYLVTWSHRPIQVDENHPGPLSPDDDMKNYVIWDVKTGAVLRSFATLDLPGPSVDESGNPVKKKIQWPAFKWSSDDKYVARLQYGKPDASGSTHVGSSIAVYELPRMNMLDKSSVKIDGVQDFEWAPSLPRRESKREYEQLFCFWTPEMGSSPARVGLMSIPNKEIVRTRNLFNVSDAKLHWQSDAKYVCVKVDRHSKSKKSLATNLEIFRIQEKGVPVEVVDSLKDTVINFAWEPKGDRFVLITAGEIPMNAAVPPKTAVHFFCPEKSKGPVAGNYRLIRTIEKKNSNAIYWSPKGRFVVVATIHSQQSFELDFWDLDFEGEKDEKDKDLTANLTLMGSGEHYGVTDVHWDPTGRFVATVASVWKHPSENGYHIYDFKGTLLREEHVDRFKQLEWRPRPPTLLSKEEQKTVRKNLRDYSQRFAEEDQSRRDAGNRAVVEERRRKLIEWIKWHEQAIERVVEDFGTLDAYPMAKAERDDGAGEEMIEEVVEEIVEEREEVLN